MSTHHVNTSTQHALSTHPTNHPTSHHTFIPSPVSIQLHPSSSILTNRQTDRRTGTAEGPASAMAAPGFELTAMVLVKRVIRIPVRMKAAPPVVIMKRKGFNDSQKGGLMRDPSGRGAALMLAKQVNHLTS